MKSMTCRQLGGPCNKKFYGDTFEEVAKSSRKHCMEMLQIGDEDHLYAINEMSLIKDHPEEMKKWLKTKKNEFAELPEEDSE